MNNQKMDPTTSSSYLLSTSEFHYSSKLTVAEGAIRRWILLPLPTTYCQPHSFIAHQSWLSQKEQSEDGSYYLFLLLIVNLRVSLPIKVDCRRRSNQKMDPTTSSYYLLSTSEFHYPSKLTVAEGAIRRWILLPLPTTYCQPQSFITHQSWLSQKGQSEDGSYYLFLLLIVNLRVSLPIKVDCRRRSNQKMDPTTSSYYLLSTSEFHYPSKLTVAEGAIRRWILLPLPTTYCQPQSFITHQSWLSQKEQSEDGSYYLFLLLIVNLRVSLPIKVDCRRRSNQKMDPTISSYYLLSTSEFHYPSKLTVAEGAIRRWILLPLLLTSVDILSRWIFLCLLYFAV